MRSGLLVLAGVLLVCGTAAGAPLEITIVGGSNSPPSDGYGPTLVEYCPDGVTIVLSGNFSACPGMPPAVGPIGPVDTYQPIADPTNPEIPYDPGVTGGETIDQAAQRGSPGAGALVTETTAAGQLYATLDFTPVVMAINWVSGSIQNLGVYLGDWLRHLTNVVASGLAAVQNAVVSATNGLSAVIVNTGVVVGEFLGQKIDQVTFAIGRFEGNLVPLVAGLPDRIRAAFDQAIADIQGQIAGVAGPVVTELQNLTSAVSGLGGGGGKGGGYDPSGNSIAGDCAAGYVCNSVDPIQCSVALAEFQARCDLTGQNALSTLGMGALQNSGSVDDGNPLRNSDTVDVSGLFGPQSPNASSCPAAANFSFMGAAYSFDLSGVCSMFAAGGYFVLLMAAFAALRIIGA